MSATRSKTAETDLIEKSSTVGTGFPWAFGTSAMQAWVEIGTEAVRFVSDRLQQDVKMQRALLRCTSLAEMQKIQDEFLRSIQDQYAAEAHRMMELMRGTVAGQIAAPKAREYDDVPV